jgi:hypothetical protein
MGLDMYLTARQYVSGWDHSSDEEKKAFSGLLRAAGLKRSEIADGSPHGYFEFCVAYWRKSNQVHGWFVRNVQKNVDDCGDYYVSKENLQTLLTACKEVLADHSKAEFLLPPSKGFFFGQYELDEWYFKDLEETVKMLTPLVTDAKWKDWDLQYHSSW